EWPVEILNSVPPHMLACQNTGSTATTDGSGHKRFFEKHSLGGQLIDSRRLEHCVARVSHTRVRLVVGQEEDKVGAVGRTDLRRAGQRNQEQGQDYKCEKLRRSESSDSKPRRIVCKLSVHIQGFFLLFFGGAAALVTGVDSTIVAGRFARLSLNQRLC